MCAIDYARAKNRVILLDYDGTLVPSTTYDQPPSPELLQYIRALADDVNNAMVCIVSGRERSTLDDWFASTVPSVSLLAEHRYWYKAPDWGVNPGWQCLVPAGTEEHIARWRAIVLPILEQYTDSTDGSFIKDKETSVVWHYRDADPDFGAWQAKELMDHLESVLVNDPVDVFAGSFHVEIKPQGVSKGTAVEMFLGASAANHLRRGGNGGDDGDRKVDFILAVGDDRSDEETFIAIEEIVSDPNSAVMPATTCPMPVSYTHLTLPTILLV